MAKSQKKNNLSQGEERVDVGGKLVGAGGWKEDVEGVTNPKGRCGIGGRAGEIINAIVA